jgi:hypothetical protein
MRPALLIPASCGLALMAVLAPFQVGLVRPGHEPAGAAAIPRQNPVRVEGTLSMASSVQAQTSLPSRYRRAGVMGETGTRTEVRPPQTDAVVYLEAIDGQVPLQPPASRPTLDQKDLTFVPQVLPVMRGTTVEFTNHDGIYHNVFSLSDAKKFDVGRRPTGERVPVTFERAGVIRIFCDIHATMSAYIVVLETPWFATVDEQGRWAVSGVPPGRYLLNAWHPTGGTEPREITVPAEGIFGLEIVLH